MMQEVEALKTIQEFVCSYFFEEQFTLSYANKYLVLTSCICYNKTGCLKLYFQKNV